MSAKPIHRNPFALSLAAGLWLLGAASVGAAQAECPSQLHLRTPEEVLADLAEAIAAGDLDRALCNYHWDATLVSDFGVDRGHELIRATLEFQLLIWGGELPQIIHQVTVPVPAPNTYMARQTYVVDTPCVSWPDGIATYVIRKGRIEGQTDHASPVFHCLP